MDELLAIMVRIVENLLRPFLSMESRLFLGVVAGLLCSWMDHLLLPAISG